MSKDSSGTPLLYSAALSQALQRARRLHPEYDIDRERFLIMFQEFSESKESVGNGGWNGGRCEGDLECLA